MKKLAGLMLALLLTFGAAWAASATDEDMLALVQQRYGDCQVTSHASQGDVGACVLIRDEQTQLALLSRQAGTWQEDFISTSAVSFPWCGTVSVALEQDGQLILAFQGADAVTPSMEQYYRRSGDQWLLTGVRSIEASGTEFIAAVERGMVTHTVRQYDAEGRLLFSRSGAPLPDVLTPAERSLRQIDQMACPLSGSGYALQEDGLMSREVVRRLFDTLVQGDAAYVSGWGRTGLVPELAWLADRPDGTRVLLYADWQEDMGWSVAQSSPLPVGTTLGLENFTDALALPYLDGALGVGVGRRADGAWGVTYVLGSEVLLLGPGWISAGLPGTVVHGTAPWDAALSDLDWAALPLNLEKAIKAMDTSGWATPNNPVSDDRLHLRTKPDQEAASLGKYSNGTPVRVLRRGDTWCKVQVGETVGYMMTRYLAFGKAAAEVWSPLLPCMAAQPVTQVLLEGEAEPQPMSAAEVDRFLVIGVVEQEYWLIWQPYTGQFGRIEWDALQAPQG